MRMNSPLAQVKAALERLGQESSTTTANSTDIKVVFRPPALVDTQIVAEPFRRVCTPRLRSKETFSGPLAS
jgi:hypothetical protein